MTDMPSQPTPSLHPIELSSTYGENAQHMANDLIRVIAIQCAVQLMLVLADSTGKTQFFSSLFLSLVIYISLGVMLYWLVLRKLFVFV